jgi:hypothetical protein
MADHTALPTRASRFGDLCAWLRKFLPSILQASAVAVGLAAAVLLLAEDAPDIAVGIFLGGGFAETLVICWRSMVAAWPDLDDGPRAPG